MFSKTYQLLVRDIQKSNRTDNNKYYTYTIMKKKLNLILFVLFSIFSLNINAHDFEAVNSDGKTIYYNITSSEDLTVSVSYRGSSYISYINEYGGDISIPSSVLYNGETYSVTSIGDLAFFYCRNLTSITIPNSVTSIGDDAFSSCDGLTSINVDSNNPSYTSLNGVLFNKGKTELIKYPEGKEGSYTIPNSVTSIGDYAFSSCDGLTSITIPNSVTSIGEKAFYWCDGLTSITIPNNVTSIGDEAFCYCNDLTSITIPNSVTSIGDKVFYLCSALTSINVDSGNPSYTSLNGVLFNKGKTELIKYPEGKEGSYTIPNSVTSIGDYAFSSCDGLTSITIPNSVTSIGNNAFANCRGLTSVTIPNSVTSIGNEAFWDCDGLTSVTIPNSVTSIGEKAFYWCDGLTSVTIGNSVTSIGDYAFTYCDGLTSINVDSNNPSYTSLNGVLFNKGKTELIKYPEGKEGSYTIPNSVTSIEDWAFYSCEGLTSITIPNSVTSIGNEAFWDCDGLTSVTIPNSVTSIGENAFYNCDDLTSVTIGNSVTSIGNYAFSQCYALTEIYSLSSDPAVCDAGSFSGVDKTIPVYIPFGSKNAYKSAAEWKEFTNFIESEFTGVEENEISASDIKVISGNGIEVNDYYGRMCIVNIAGQVIKDAYVNGSIQISLPKGIYIVVTENNSQKVIL